jgi:hypothetical protein
VWGLKLPATVLILPELMAAFPQAKIVHLVRHPINSCIRRTHITSRMDNPIGQAVLRAAYQDRGRPIEAIEADDDFMRNAITWAFQVGHAMAFGRNAVSDAQYMEIRYEDICANPQATAKDLQCFLGLDQMSVDMPNIDTSRMNETDFSDPRVQSVLNICGGVASNLGYDVKG